MPRERGQQRDAQDAVNDARGAKAAERSGEHSRPGRIAEEEWNARGRQAQERGHRDTMEDAKLEGEPAYVAHGSASCSFRDRQNQSSVCSPKNEKHPPMRTV